LVTRLLVGVAGVTSFVATLFVVHYTKMLEPWGTSGPATTVAVQPKPKPVQTSVDSNRPVFRYSIVPGGVRSSTEVTRAMQLDPVVKNHYAKVVPASLRSETLSAPMTAHVSYRVGDKVYWTKKTVALPAGEKVLTDGTTMLRQRCGNIISMEPLAPALEAEPAIPDFDLHVDPFAPVTGIPVYLPSPYSGIGLQGLQPGVSTGLPPAGSSGTPESPTFYSFPPVPPTGMVPPVVPPGGPTGTPTLFDVPPTPTPTPTPTDTPTPTGTPDPRDTPPGGGDPPNVPLDPPTPVPEPGTWVLLATGLGIGAARLLKKR
jgi:hypothetical protein